MSPAPEGLTVIEGNNGDGKTNLLEAIGYLATLRSFRGAPTEALVRRGREAAVVRAETDQGGRAVLLEAELRPGQRDRVMVNRQRLARSRDLLGVFQVSVFAPDDLVLVQGGPNERRRFLDEAVVAAHPRHDALRVEVERVLRQRG
ncbi:MAG: DNA replication and repair protein RecF, partial [Acidimicrobiales bacterium]